MGSGRKRRAATLAMGLGFAVACAHELVPVSPNVVASDASDDLMAAIVKYRDKTIKLRGKVVDKGVRRAKILHLTITGVGDVAWGGAYKTTENYGYLVLEGPGEAPGNVVCFFDPSYLEELTRVEKNTTVTTGCIFTDFAGKKTAPVGVFRCGVVDELEE